MIPVVKPYIPNRKKLDKYLDGVFERNWLTNNGPLVRLLTERLQEYLDVENLLLVNNGTLALQVAYAALGIKKVNSLAITTPFSFVATASTLRWEGVEPTFCDIDKETFCLNHALIEPLISNETNAIVPVHVFGNACAVNEIGDIARKKNLKVIYDGAHAFGIKHDSKSILCYGDACTLSFHATKLFHTIEGGAVVFSDREAYESAKKIINFGFDERAAITTVGINAKMNEIQAAVGLTILEDINLIFEQREEIWSTYKQLLKGYFSLQKRDLSTSNNYSYFPILFETERGVLNAIETLNRIDIFPRRYFHPSLEHTNSANEGTKCPIAADIASRILCLPIYPGLSKDSAKKIATAILPN